MLLTDLSFLGELPAGVIGLPDHSSCMEHQVILERISLVVQA
jgi:hypothetical protein